MRQANDNRFHPKRWTAVTWLAIVLWSWQGFALNYPPAETYTVDPVTGERSEPTRYESLSEVPFPIGFPLHYITPSPAFLGPFPATPIGAPLPPPSSVSVLAMAANFTLIVTAIIALVYMLQRFMPQYSMRTIFAVMSAFPVYYGLGRLIVMFAGHQAHRWYFIAVYFSPIAAVIAVRYSAYPRSKWASFRSKLKPLSRSCNDYDRPDDAIAAATRFDRLGDWDAAIDLYRHAAQRWPEHAEYIQHCIDRVAEKQSLAQR
jgi:hypothetical protein